MAASNRTRRSGPGSPWEFVPDPTRTIFYLLLAVGATLTAQWIPEFAGRWEEQNYHLRSKELRTEAEQKFQRWRREHPQQAMQEGDLWDRTARQANQNAEGNMPYAPPIDTLPRLSSESSTPANLN
jgi:hypothetical protein